MAHASHTSARGQRCSDRGLSRHGRVPVHLLCAHAAPGRCSRGRAMRVSADTGPRHAHEGLGHENQAAGTAGHIHALIPGQPEEAHPTPGTVAEALSTSRRQDSCSPRLVDGVTEREGSGAPNIRSSAQQRLSPTSPLPPDSSVLSAQVPCGPGGGREGVTSAAVSRVVLPHSPCALGGVRGRAPCTAAPPGGRARGARGGRGACATFCLVPFSGREFSSANPGPRKLLWCPPPLISARRAPL